MIPLHTESGCSAVGSALRSGRRGRQFESGHPDKKREATSSGRFPFCFAGAGPVPVRNQCVGIDNLFAIRVADGHRARPCKAKREATT